MDPITASLILGGLSFGSSIFSAKSAEKGQNSANQMSLDSAREQMAFQERMSNTAHQREVADLEKAGLNKILSANAGASTPGGAMGSFQSNQAVAAPMREKAFGNALNSAQTVANIGLTKQATQSEISKQNLQDAQAASADINSALTASKLPKGEFFAGMWDKTSRYANMNPKELRDRVRSKIKKYTPRSKADITFGEYPKG